MKTKTTRTDNLQVNKRETAYSFTYQSDFTPKHERNFLIGPKPIFATCLCFRPFIYYISSCHFFGLYGQTGTSLVTTNKSDFYSQSRLY